jgi:hypothetical protein
LMLEDKKRISRSGLALFPSVSVATTAYPPRCPALC